MAEHGIGAEAGGYRLDGKALHIAAIDFPAFYAEAAGSLQAAREFYDTVSTPGSPILARAQLILHQAARMVWLADRVKAVSEGRPALQILFYVIAAEAVAKLAVGYEGDQRSWPHILMFFNVFLTDEQRIEMHRALDGAQPRPGRSPDELVDYLYGLRCDVAHEGRYFDMLVTDDVCITVIRSVLSEII